MGGVAGSDARDAERLEAPFGTGRTLAVYGTLAPGAALATDLKHLPKRRALPALFLMCNESWAMGLEELKVAYHAAITEDTGPVQAEGTIVTMGRRRAAFTDARLVDARGRLYASATSSLLITRPT